MAIVPQIQINDNLQNVNFCLFVAFFAIFSLKLVQGVATGGFYVS